MRVLFHRGLTGNDQCRLLAARARAWTRAVRLNPWPACGGLPGARLCSMTETNGEAAVARVLSGLSFDARGKIIGLRRTRYRADLRLFADTRGGQYVFVARRRHYKSRPALRTIPESKPLPIRFGLARARSLRRAAAVAARSAGFYGPTIVRPSLIRTTLSYRCFGELKSGRGPTAGCGGMDRRTAGTSRGISHAEDFARLSRPARQCASPRAHV